MAPLTTKIRLSRGFRFLNRTLQSSKTEHRESECFNEAQPLPASRKVVDITELLENILLYLPLRTLLCSERVSKQFQDVIKGSPNIRQALFVEPLSKPTHAQQAIMATYSPRIVYDPVEQQNVRQEYIPEGLPINVHINPLLDGFLRYREMEHFGGGVRSRRKCHMLQHAPTSFRSLRKSPTSASWRRMLVVQPLAAPLYGNTFLAPAEHIGCENGLRMQQVYELHLKYIKLLRQIPSSERRWLYPSSAYELHAGLFWTLDGTKERTMCRAHREEAIQNMCGWDVTTSNFDEPTDIRDPSQRQRWDNVCRRCTESQQTRFTMSDVMRALTKGSSA